MSSLLKKYLLPTISAFMVILAVVSIVSVVNKNVQQSTEIDTASDELVVPEVIPVLDRSSLTSKPAIELLAFSDWLEQEQVSGFIGELGWPDRAEYSVMSAEVIEILKFLSLPTTLWSSGSSWPDSYPLLYFQDTDKDSVLDGSTPQSIEAKQLYQDQTYGVNVAGLEFGASTSSFSARNPGTLGTDYFTEVEQSYAYLASQNVGLVRLPFSWERLQPELYGELDDAYAQLIVTAIEHADKNNLKIVLDLHNYGRYKPTQSTTLLLGSTQLPANALSDVWKKLDAMLQNNKDAIYGYGIMNEPYDLANGALGWEQTSQTVVERLRAENISARLLVAGYEYSKLSKWSENHPTSWITDPLNNFDYEAHHYWDEDSSGRYLQ